MRVIQPSYRIVHPTDFSGMLERLEAAGRTCYQSEPVGDPARFVQARIKSGHESVIEHEIVSVRFICDRGISHELVRHRLCSFSQESTRYCNYGRPDSDIEVVCPRDLVDHHLHLYQVWRTGVMAALHAYTNLIQEGVTPQIARSVLPNCLKTELVMTANLREWRTIFSQRCAPAAHPQMRELMIPLCHDLAERLPAVFGDLAVQCGKD